MEYFKEIQMLAGSDEIREGSKLPEVKLHKWLTLGNTSYACRYGVLGDGHDHIHIADQYHQAHREYYYLSMAAKETEAGAKRAEAKRIRALERLKTVKHQADILEAEADLSEAEAALAGSLYRIQDIKRQISVYTGFIAQMKTEVEAKYPNGYEEAQPDIWKTQALYRIHAGENLKSIPMPTVDKALLGLQTGRAEAMAPLLATRPEYANMLADSQKSQEKLMRKHNND